MEILQPIVFLLFLIVAASVIAFPIYLLCDAIEMQIEARLVRIAFRAFSHIQILRVQSQSADAAYRALQKAKEKAATRGRITFELGRCTRQFHRQGKAFHQAAAKALVRVRAIGDELSGIAVQEADAGLRDTLMALAQAFYNYANAATQAWQVHDLTATQSCGNMDGTTLNVSRESMYAALMNAIATNQGKSDPPAVRNQNTLISWETNENT